MKGAAGGSERSRPHTVCMAWKYMSCVRWWKVRRKPRSGTAVCTSTYKGVLLCAFETPCCHCIAVLKGDMLKTAS